MLMDCIEQRQKEDATLVEIFNMLNEGEHFTHVSRYEIDTMGG